MTAVTATPAPMAQGATRADMAALRRVGQEFESVFLGQMVAHLFAGIGDDPLTGGGPAGDLYRSMLRDEYGKTVARAGGLGIADAVVRQLLKLQGETSS